MIEKYPSDTIFLFYFTTKGYEDLFLRLYAYFGIKIHVDSDHYAQFARLSDPAIYSNGPLFVPPEEEQGRHYDSNRACLTTELTRFRSCHPDCECGTRAIPGVVHTKVAVAPPQWVLRARNKALPVDTKFEKVVNSFDAMNKQLQVFTIGLDQRPACQYEGEFNATINSQYIKSKDRLKLLPCHIRYNFSRHSSFSEIYNLIKLFRPKQVYPFDHGIGGDKRLRMKEVFGEICSGDHIFRFDQERAEFEKKAMAKAQRFKSSDSDLRSSSRNSSICDDIAESLWLEGSASLDKSGILATPPPTNTSMPGHTIHEEAASLNSTGTLSTLPATNVIPPGSSILPFFGTTETCKAQKGWNCKDKHGVPTSTKLQVFMNSEANFKSPEPKTRQSPEPKSSQPVRPTIMEGHKIEDSPERDYDDVLDMLWANQDNHESDSNSLSSDAKTAPQACANPLKRQISIPKSSPSRKRRAHAKKPCLSRHLSPRLKIQSKRSILQYHESIENRAHAPSNVRSFYKLGE